MEWQLSVPKILHVYWGGDIMPYIRYMTVKSFIHFNPDWKVILWLPSQSSVVKTWDSWELNYKVKCDDYFPKLKELPIEQIEVDFRQFGYENTISEVHKSDFLRLHLLYTQGGLWSDMDILYFKPMTELSVNVPQNRDKDTFVCISSYGHSAGFLMGAQGSKYYEKLTQLTRQHFVPKDYQGIGATMFNRYYPHFHDVNKISPSVNIEMDAVYAHDAFHIAEILNGKPARFTDKSIGIHWYAGHPLWGKFMDDTNGGLTNLPDNIIGDVLRKISQ